MLKVLGVLGVLEVLEVLGVLGWRLPACSSAHRLLCSADSMSLAAVAISSAPRRRAVEVQPDAYRPPTGYLTSHAARRTPHVVRRHAAPRTQHLAPST